MKKRIKRVLFMLVIAIITVVAVIMLWQENAGKKQKEAIQRTIEEVDTTAGKSEIESPTEVSGIVRNQTKALSE